jgi:hypothetical protein
MRKRKGAKPTTPSVGMIYLVGGKLLIDSTPLVQAGSYSDSAIHEPDHISYWAEPRTIPLVSGDRSPETAMRETGQPLGEARFVVRWS